MKLAEEKLVLLQIFGGEPFRIQYNLSSCRLYPIGRKGEAMKATFISGALIILLAVAGCGGNSIIHTGGPTGPFLFMVGQTSDNLFTFTGSDSGAISPMSSVPTGHAPSAVVMESLSSFQMNLFVADSASNNVAVFNIDPSTGRVSPTGISVAVGANPIEIGLREPSGIGGP